MKHYCYYCRFNGQTTPHLDTMYWLVFAILLSNSIHRSKLAMMPCHVISTFSHCLYLF